ncbi:t-SNARE [Amylocarpus encephaloides]|uniref:t-SNARE n=1 Tax=Amylocarpus encephaloides TaxID=45428 RepID=A0A9P8C4V3_9HELO|nr:t-SNARE [Amylocarpus encephaloides]
MSQYANNYGPNPYDRRQDVSPGYNSPQFRSEQQYGVPVGGRDDYGSQNVELTPLANNGSQFGSQDNTKSTLDQCKFIRDTIDDMERNDIPALKNAQQASLNSPDPARAAADVATRSRQIMDSYRGLVGQIRVLKSNPQNQNEDISTGRQVISVNKKLTDTMVDYRRLDYDFERKLKEQIARQYRIVRPDASEKEVREAVENDDSQIFSQALMQSDRRGQAQSTLSAVKSRHDEIQKIAQQMAELAQLFTQMDELVVQQEAAVTDIETKGEEVVEHMDQGTGQIQVAIQSAKNARKWKWWCLGIAVLIVIIIVVVVLIVKFVVNNNPATPKPAATKRFALPLEARRVVAGPYSPTTPSITEREPVAPAGLAFDTSGRLVNVGVDYVPGSKKARSFQA